MLASVTEVTAVNGSYYGKILARSFLFLSFFFLSSRQLKKIFLRKKMYSVARVTVVSKLLQQKPDITYQTTELLI